MKPFLLAVALGGIVLQGIGAPSWPQFRGPNSTGVAAVAKPPAKFGPNENVLWQIDLPFSPSSPVIWGDHIFVTTFDAGKLQVRDYRRTDGENNWARAFTVPLLEEFNQTDGSPAASSPATDGKRLLVYFGSFGLVCLDFDGNELWTAPMPAAQTAGGFGSGTSPIIVGSKAILVRDQEGNSMIAAYDLNTGKKLWHTARAGQQTSYSTPALWEKGNRADIIVAGSQTMKGYDLETGTERWTFRPMPAFNCTTPAVTEDLIFYAGWCPGKSDSPWPGWAQIAEKFDRNKDGKITPDEFGDEGAWLKTQDHDKDGAITSKDWAVITEAIARGDNSAVAIKPGGEGDVSTSHLVWRADRGLPYVASPLHYEGRVYMVKDGGMVSCYDAKTGKAHYVQERIDAMGNYYASPVAADGRIFFASLNGKVTAIKAGGDKPEIVQQADFKERISATPAIVGENLYIRTQTKLYGFGPK